MDKIAIVLPTCNPKRRPFLEFVESRIRKQTLKPDLYIKVDYINTGGTDLSGRYKHGIKQAIDQGSDFILFFEDDDYYPVNYIENMHRQWVKHGKPDIIGHNISINYYPFEKRYYIKVRDNFCSCHCTAISKNARYDICPDNVSTYDGILWEKNSGTMVSFTPPPVGIKHNIGMTGGRVHGFFGKYDKNLSYLKSIVDDEGFAFYSKLKRWT